MSEMIENRMIVDSEWTYMVTEEVKAKLLEPGYHEYGTNVFVPESEAYDFALERCLNGSEEDMKEFKEMLVEWFYSGGNWKKEIAG